MLPTILVYIIVGVGVYMFFYKMHRDEIKRYKEYTKQTDKEEHHHISGDNVSRRHERW